MQEPSPTVSTRPRLAYGRVEAAEILGVKPVTVDRLAKRGLLRPSRATRRPLYPLWELERFLRETSGGTEL
jgi:hypothetical protein